jgi:hypothetical protein
VRVVVNYRYGTGIDFVFDDNVLSVLPDSGFPDPDISIPDLGSRVKKGTELDPQQRIEVFITRKIVTKPPEYDPGYLSGI